MKNMENVFITEFNDILNNTFSHDSVSYQLRNDGNVNNDDKDINFILILMHFHRSLMAFQSHSNMPYSRLSYGGLCKNLAFSQHNDVKGNWDQR